MEPNFGEEGILHWVIYLHGLTWSEVGLATMLLLNLKDVSFLLTNQEVSLTKVKKAYRVPYQQF